MYKGTLELIGGNDPSPGSYASDSFDYNGIVETTLRFIVEKETKEEVIEKLRAALKDVKGIAFPNATDEYRAAVAGLPDIAARKLDERFFHFTLNFDDYDSRVARASWKIEEVYIRSIVLQ